MFLRVILSEAGHQGGASKDQQEGAQKLLEPSQEQAEVVEYLLRLNHSHKSIASEFFTDDEVSVVFRPRL
jgi:hypothetical protein